MECLCSVVGAGGVGAQLSCNGGRRVPPPFGFRRHAVVGAPAATRVGQPSPS